MIKNVEVDVKSVFFIEGEKFLRDMLELIFKDRGLSIYTIESAADCVYLIDDLKPDLIVADLNTLIPNITPFFSALDEKGLSIPILALGHASTWDELKEFQSRFVGFEHKPLSPTGVIERFSKHCL